MTFEVTPLIEQTIIAAATVIVFRRAAGRMPELLMVQRSKALSFAGAAAVFPGGKVQLSDCILSQKFDWLEADEAAARIAAIRETLEETGLILGVDCAPTASQAIAARSMVLGNEDLGPILTHFGWGLDLAALVPFARWVPTFKPGRVFDTRFYLADLGTGNVELSPDLGENTHLFWVSAVEALEMVEDARLQMIYPTRRNLERLAQFSSFAEVCDHVAATVQEVISPWTEYRNGIEMLCIPENLGYPVSAAPLSQAFLS